MNTATRVAIALALTCVGGCVPGYKILVRILAPGKIEFSVDQKREEQQLCMSAFGIRPVDARGQPGDEIWSVRGDECFRTIIYPNARSGFALAKSGKLVAGRKYVAEAKIGVGLGQSSVFIAP